MNLLPRKRKVVLVDMRTILGQYSAAHSANVISDRIATSNWFPLLLPEVYVQGENLSFTDDLERDLPLAKLGMPDLETVFS